MRQRDWRDSVTLWARTLEIYPRCQAALLNYGNALVVEGRWKEARVPLQALLARSPDYPRARANLAATFIGEGDYAAAIEQYQAELSARPNDADARRRLGWALEKQRASAGPGRP